MRDRRKTLEKIEKIVARASPEEEVFYQDEADVHLNPKIGSTYLKRGQQPVVMTPGKNVKRYIFGALNARTGRVIYGVAERRNAEVFTQFLDFLSTRYRCAKRIHIAHDNYIIHKAHCVVCRLEALGARIVLHFLPPYSPNGNVIERLWKQLHDHVTRNHQHRTIESLVEAVKRFLDNVQAFPGTQVSTLRTVSCLCLQYSAGYLDALEAVYNQCWSLGKLRREKRFTLHRAGQLHHSPSGYGGT